MMTQLVCFDAGDLAQAVNIASRTIMSLLITVIFGLLCYASGRWGR